MRLLNSSTPQNSEVINCVPQPNSWHVTCELNLKHSHHTYLLLLCILPFCSYLSLVSANVLSKIRHPNTSSFHLLVCGRAGEHMGSISQSYVTHISISQNLIHACWTRFPTQQISLVSLYLAFQHDAVT